MPLTIGLSAYSIRLKRARERSKDFAIMTTGGEVDGWELFSTYLLDRRNQMMKVTHAEDEQSGTVTVSKAFKLVDLKQDKKNGTFCGLINAGECGRANSIYDVEKDVITHEKKITEADMPPFYFRLHVLTALPVQC